MGGWGRNLQVREFHTWDSSYNLCKLTITLFPKWRNEIGGGRNPSVQVAKGESRFVGSAGGRVDRWDGWGG